MNSDTHLLGQQWKELSPNDSLISQHPEHSEEQHHAEQRRNSIAPLQEPDKRENGQQHSADAAVQVKKGRIPRAIESTQIEDVIMIRRNQRHQALPIQSASRP